MDRSTSSGAQYVRLAPGVAVEIAPYLGVAPEEIDELLLELAAWPAEIHPVPRVARDGRLIPGDPLLVGAGDLGLLFAHRDPSNPEPVLVDWDSVRSLDVIGLTIHSRLGVVCHP